LDPIAWAARAHLCRPAAQQLPAQVQQGEPWSC